ncbi:MAG: phospho-N-acetylmuramoyl-pentapeptide-transferase [Holophagales bacterium]|jgi:phospho-N-acetylmuramoyl-pentapeptide-transferase|nr:phospho-N-acetylmuramoyl-pentapeptide-transferase [Holophagales bacterium]
MIPWILYPIRDLLPAKIFSDIANLFSYATFRTAVAAATAFTLSLLLGPWLISTLKSLNMGQHIREEGPEHHLTKGGTPTMGGLLVVGVIVISTLFWCKLDSGHIWVALLSLVGFAAVGAIDDAKKLRKKNNRGLSAIVKLLALTVICLLVAGLILYFGLRGEETSRLAVPFFKNWRPDVGIFLIPWIWLVMVGTSNAVNLTDGLDGLAIGGILIVSATFAVLAYVAGHIGMANYLFVPFVSGASELAVFLGAMAGASLGFLWFNAHPAEVFMGDTGSLGLGGALGTAAILIHQELLLVIAGGLFVWEALSVIIQVGSYKLRRGKRIFRMAPFHHHMELGGLKETKVVIRLWIMAVVCSILALSSLKLG